MAGLPVFLDECVQAQIAPLLRERGFTATSALDERRLQLDDERQLIYATAQGRVLLTYDHRDFLRLHRMFHERGQAHGGIIVLPRRSELELQVLRASMMLDWLATLADFRSQFFRWGALQQELIGGYRLAGYGDADIRLALGQQ
jgi:hypothetical protein